MFRSIAVLILSLSTFTAQAALLGRAPATANGNDYQAYYDTVLDITWLADANYAQTSGYVVDGAMTWEAAEGWIASLNGRIGGLGYLGTNVWRLPTVTDTGEPGCDGPAYSGTDCGYNVDLSTGEMAHMFYSTLGNPGDYTTGGESPNPLCGGGLNFCLNDVGPFSNLQPTAYWSGTEYAPDPGSAWYFSFAYGLQNDLSKSTAFNAWAVRPGDIAVVPLPGGIWLLGTALAGFGGRQILRRKSPAQAQRCDWPPIS